MTDAQEQLLQSAKKVAVELVQYDKSYGRTLTGLIGELSACKDLDLDWRPGPGFDAESAQIKYQIKTRKSETTPEVNSKGRIGKFGRKAGYNFDWGLLVELDDHFTVLGIWQLSRDVIVDLERDKDGRGLHVGKFKSCAVQVYPRRCPNVQPHGSVRRWRHRQHHRRVPNQGRPRCNAH